MIKLTNIRFVLALLLLALSCEKIPLVEADATNLTWEEKTWEEERVRLEKDGFRSEQQFRHPSMSEEQYQGAINAVRKAYQLTDITFTPLLPIEYNIGTYQPDYTYKGMIYSSVKEIGTYIGSNISFHTFMTAIHNPRSKIYTDRVDKRPYHGTNCRSYYGVVCSSLVSYALGLIPEYRSHDFADSPEMIELDIDTPDFIHIADVLWKSGHVAIVTNVYRDSNDHVQSVEICEAIHQGSRKVGYSYSSFQSLITSSFKKVFRYTNLANNVVYSPATQFVTVMDETPSPFIYNDMICVDKGDRSCYFENEPVVLNCLTEYERIDIFKDDDFFTSYSNEGSDIRLDSLSFGYYRARLVKSDSMSDFTSWIVVNTTVGSEKIRGRINLTSINARPISLFFCDISGGRGYPATRLFSKGITQEEIDQGFITIPRDKLMDSRPYFVVTYSTEYGNITSLPQKWL